jgi:hypothetical protein
LADVIALFERNREASPETAAKGAIIENLYALVGSAELSASEIMSLLNETYSYAPAVSAAYKAIWPKVDKQADGDAETGNASTTDVENLVDHDALLEKRGVLPLDAQEHLDNLTEAFNVINGLATKKVKSLGKVLAKLDGFRTDKYKFERRSVHKTFKYRVVPTIVPSSDELDQKGG